MQDEGGESKEETPATEEASTEEATPAEETSA